MKASNRRATHTHIYDTTTVAGAKLRKLGPVVQIGEKPYRADEHQILEPSPSIRPALEKLPGRGSKGSTSSPSGSHRGENNAQQKVAAAAAPAVNVANLIK